MRAGLAGRRRRRGRRRRSTSTAIASRPCATGVGRAARRRRRGSPASRCRAWPTPTATPSTGPCAARTQAGVGARSGRGASRCTRLAERADAGLVPPPGRGRVRRDGAGRHHVRRRVPLPPPRRRRASRTPTRTRWARRCVAAARRPGIRLTLLDTCYLHGGIGAEPERRPAAVQRRRRRSAWAERAAALDALDGRRPCGSAPRSTPCGPSTRRRWRSSRRGPTSAASPLHAHVSEQPAENERLPRRLRRHAGRRCSAAHGAARRAVHRRPRHPPHRRRRRRASAPAVARCASARRPSATSPTASARPRRCVDAGAPAAPRLRLARGDRPVRGGARRRARRAAGQPACGATTTPPSLLRAATADGHASLGWPEAGRLAVGARWPTCARSPRLGAPGRRRPDHVARGGRCSRRRRPTSTTSSSAARSSSRDGAHVRLDVGERAGGRRRRGRGGTS